LSVYIPILVAVFSTVATALFGVWSYRQQKTIDRQNYIDQKDTDRKNELIHRRMNEYERYLTAYRAKTSLRDFNRNPAWDSPEVIKVDTEYWLAYSSLFQIASDSVLLSVAKFHKFAWMRETDLPDGEAWTQEFKRLYATMIFEMRTDAFEETKLPKELVEDHLPFNFPYTIKLTDAGQPQPDKTEQAK
jgi:hypothetical protein